MVNKKAQVWVETVVYTLIGIVLIGVVLAVATPTITKQKDKITISKSVDMMIDLDNTISNVETYVGTRKNFDMKISNGVLSIDGIDDKITFEIDDSKYAYSEPGKTIKLSQNLEVKTSEKSGKYIILLTLDYDNKLNMTIKGIDTKKQYTKNSLGYVVSISNKGITSGQTLQKIDFEELNY
ncbi:MAG: hypothetical protein WC533_01070 [Candidatus Pacearchaeota archaeon]